MRSEILHLFLRHPLLTGPDGLVKSCQSPLHPTAHTLNLLLTQRTPSQYSPVLQQTREGKQGENGQLRSTSSPPPNEIQTLQTGHSSTGTPSPLVAKPFARVTQRRPMEVAQHMAELVGGSAWVGAGPQDSCVPGEVAYEGCVGLLGILHRRSPKTSRGSPASRYGLAVSLQNSIDKA